MKCLFDLSDVSIEELEERIKDHKIDIETINLIFKDGRSKNFNLQIHHDHIERYEDAIQEKQLKEMNE